MDQITKRSANSTRLAVNRVYQPARIERELLAKVFDLVELGGRKDFALDDSRQGLVASAVGAQSNGQITTSSVGVNNPSHVIELEEVV